MACHKHMQCNLCYHDTSACSRSTFGFHSTHNEHCLGNFHAAHNFCKHHNAPSFFGQLKMSYNTGGPTLLCRDLQCSHDKVRKSLHHFAMMACHMHMQYTLCHHGITACNSITFLSYATYNVRSPCNFHTAHNVCNHHNVQSFCARCGHPRKKQ